MPLRLLEELLPGLPEEDLAPQEVLLQGQLLQGGLGILLQLVHHAGRGGSQPLAVGEREGPGPRDLQQERRRDRLVHQPDGERLLRLHRLAGQDEVERGGDAHEAGQALGAAGAGDHAQLHLGEAELGLPVVRDHPVVTGHGPLEPAAQAGAVDGRDHRLRVPLQPVEAGLPVAGEPLGLGGALHVAQHLDVGAGDEAVLLAAGEDHGLHRGVLLEGLEDRRRTRRRSPGESVFTGSPGTSTSTVATPPWISIRKFFHSLLGHVRPPVRRGRPRRPVRRRRRR